MTDTVDHVKPGDPRIEVRQVRQEDKDSILGFTINTWGDDSEDYIAEVFDHWTTRPDSEFLTITVDDRPTGISHVVDLGMGEFWLEGLRVDPNARARGLGWLIHTTSIARARARGARIIRYVTGQKNQVSRMFAARSGFEEKAALRRFQAAPNANAGFPVRLTRDHLDLLNPWLVRDPQRDLGGSYQYDWHWQVLTRDRLAVHLDRGEVHGILEGGALVAWGLGACLDGYETYVLDGETPAQVTRLIRGFEAVAAACHAAEIKFRLTDAHPYVELLRQAGYTASENALILLELR